MRQFLDATLLGVTVGMVYAAVALGLVLIWRSTRVLNFAQGAMATLTTFIAASMLEHSVGYWAAFGLALATGFAVGAATERVFIRPLEGRHPLDAVIVSIGLFIALEAVTGAVWGPNQRGFPAPFSIVSGFRLGSTPIAVTPFDLFVVVAVLVLMGAMAGVFRFTGTGLRMRAAAAAPEVAALLGVRVRSMLTLGWAVAATSGALAGLLVAPTAFLYPGNMDIYLILGFVAAVVGGLESPLGALAGGVLTGLALSYVDTYLGPGFQSSGAVVLLIGVLMLRPQGLFSVPAPRRV